MSARVDCPHAAPCGGCALIHLPVDETLRLKRARVAAALARVPLLAERDAEIDVAPCERAPAVTGYRSTARLAVAPAPAAAGGRTRSIVGARASGGAVTDLPHCKVVTHALARRVDELRARAPEGVREATLRVGTAAGGEDEPEAQVVLAGEGGARALGAARLPVEVGGVRFQISMETPLWPNLAMVAREAAIAAAWLGEGAGVAAGARGGGEPVLLCVHAGAGLHALPCARAMGDVPALLLEDDGPAADDARDAIAAAGLPAEVRALPAALAEVRPLPAAPSAPPPRPGDAPAATPGRYPAVLIVGGARALDEAQASWIAASCAGRAAYVGSDPERAARDLGRLRASGLRTVRAVPVDAEPLTDRADVVALLARTADAWAPPRLYEDEACVVLAKPGGLASTGPDSLDALLLAAAGGERTLWPVHRLDAGTSGAILFARSKAAVERLGQAFAASAVDRRYVVLAGGSTPVRETLDRALPEPGEPGKLLTARTHFERRRTLHGGAFSLLDVTVDTGRTHQIRRHLADAGHPVAGDERYGDPGLNRLARAVGALERPFVHAARLGFTSPATGARVDVEAPLPADLTYALARLDAPPPAPPAKSPPVPPRPGEPPRRTARARRGSAGAGGAKGSEPGTPPASSPPQSRARRRPSRGRRG
ncbi:MAG TPA: pseudouridine synthase [Myxococcota bacterium]|nr:pseudouridine synthase [Myxococcota bacterium]